MMLDAEMAGRRSGVQKGLSLRLYSKVALSYVAVAVSSIVR